MLSLHSWKGRSRSQERPQDPTYRRVTTLSDSDDESGDYALLRETVTNHNSSAAHPQDPRYVDRQQVRALWEENKGSQYAEILYSYLYCSKSYTLGKIISFSILALKSYPNTFSLHRFWHISGLWRNAWQGSMHQTMKMLTTSTHAAHNPHTILTHRYVYAISIDGWHCITWDAFVTLLNYLSSSFWATY